MRITVNGTPHQVDFLYWHDMQGRRVTACYFDAVPTSLGWPQRAGYVTCRPPDVFRKAEGRKQSLARALKMRGYHRAWRTTFWAAYFKQAKQ